MGQAPFGLAVEVDHLVELHFSSRAVQNDGHQAAVPVVHLVVLLPDSASCTRKRWYCCCCGGGSFYPRIVLTNKLLVAFIQRYKAK